MVKGRPKPTPANAPAEGSSLSDMYRKPAAEKSADTSDDEPDIDIGKLLKDVELFGASTWKERKQIENRKVVQLGGKATK
ncbi:hypothetical protein E2562_016366 [Oryza meyeriana var. granulata]|uniref:Uncharacterized protein n=1 Tax=Oryza meyeriana var. granulata TaxID=110450 RepID=A0A6G1DX47_9ORYZ|nr:hypothetical protein E2562_016366 [Oryza meyeriana var. granulata]